MTTTPPPPPGFVLEPRQTPAPPPGFVRAPPAKGDALGPTRDTRTDFAPRPGPAGIVPQGMSGVNEGIANVAGFPADAVGGAINGVTGLINQGFGTGIPQINNPVLGSDYWKKVMSEPGMIVPPSGNPGDAAARRVGQGIGEAAASAPLAVAGAVSPAAALGWTLLSGIGSGGGGAAANAVAPGNKWADLAGSLIGGGLPLGLGAMASHSAAVRDVIESAPTTGELATAAGKKYDIAAKNGITATPQQTTGLATKFQQIAASNRSVILPNGDINPNFSKVGHALDLFDQYAGQPLPASEFKAARSALQDAAGSSEKEERFVAKQMLNEFDNFTGQLAPELNQGNALYARAMRGKELDTLNTLAAAKAKRTGQSLGEALVSKYGGLQDKIIAGKVSGYGPELGNAVANVAEGSPARRALMNVGKASPRNPLTWGTTVVGPAIAGGSVAGPVGAAVAATGAPLAAITARALANNSARKSADLAAALARNGSPLPPVASDARNLTLAWLLAHGNEQRN